MNMMKTCAVVAAVLCASQPALAQQAHVNLDWNPHKNVQNLNPYGANVISPEVRDDRTVTFRIKAPDARTVALTGGPILLAVGKGNTPIPFDKAADGVWTLTVGPLKPNLYIYRLLVDGVAVVDPNNTYTGFADQPGYSTVVVHGDGPAYYDAKPVPHGSVTRHVYRSAVLDGEREMYVYTPPNYDRSRRYPVLYLLGGSGELASTWNIDGRAGFIADNLIAEGRALPMIIAMPNNQVVHRSDPKHTELTFSLFEKELRQHIIPVVDKAYSTRRARAGARLPVSRWEAGTRSSSASSRSTSFASFGILSAGIRNPRRARPSFSTIPPSTRRSITCSSGWARTRTSRPIAAWSFTRFSTSTASPTTTTSAVTAAMTGEPGAPTWSTCCRSCGARSQRRARPRPGSPARKGGSRRGACLAWFGSHAKEYT